MVDEPRWRRAVRNAEAVAGRAARPPACAPPCCWPPTRGEAAERPPPRPQQPTNVLTFPPAAAGLPGEIVLALGTVRREAAAAGQPAAAAPRAPRRARRRCILLGHDHHNAGEARRMEMAEARILRRLGVPNPWRRA